ncbi:MAG TPA: CYTH domain-containing protein, partial [Candidatus Limnocylindria bacterium]
MATEVEAKFLATDDGALASLASAPRLADAELGAGITFDEVDIYLDTADGRLGSQGWACRLRDRGQGFIVSLKGPPPADAAPDAWLHRRPELEAPAAESMLTADWPASEARDLLERLSGGAQLLERLRLLQRRTERGVHLDGERLGTLSLDVVTAVGTSGATAASFDVVELELASADDPVAAGHLDGLASALAEWPGLVADRRSKLER